MCTNACEKEGCDSALSVSLNVKNTGEVDGKEVVEIYVGENNPTVLRPVKELKGFEKVELKAGESKTVTVTIPKSRLGYYDDNFGAFVTNNGEYTVYACASSKDIRLKALVTL